MKICRTEEESEEMPRCQIQNPKGSYSLEHEYMNVLSEFYKYEILWAIFIKVTVNFSVALRANTIMLTLSVIHKCFHWLFCRLREMWLYLPYLCISLICMSCGRFIKACRLSSRHRFWQSRADFLYVCNHIDTFCNCSEMLKIQLCLFCIDFMSNCFLFKT